MEFKKNTYPKFSNIERYPMTNTRSMTDFLSTIKNLLLMINLHKIMEILS